MVDKEGGYTIIPELAISNLMIENEFSTIRHFDDMIPLREISLVYTRNFVKKRLLEVLDKCIKKSIPERLIDQSRGVLIEWK